MLKPEFHDRAREAFPTSISVKKLATELGTHYIKIRDFWNSEFGAEATKYRGTTSPKQFEALKPQLRGEFEGDRGLKVIAKELKMTPIRIRKYWVEEFGAEIVTGRSVRIRSETGSKVGYAKKGGTYEIRPVKVRCSDCSDDFEKSQFSGIQTCPVCTEKKKRSEGTWVDRDVQCPVCKTLVGGNKGLASHMHHQATDPAHREYLEGAEDRKWAGKVEDLDYVRCRICEERHESLFNHLKIHGVTAVEYRKTYDNAIIRSKKTYQRRVRGFYNQFKGCFGKGRLKMMECGGCGENFETSLFSSPTVHCPSCRAERLESEQVAYEKQWIGKSEPEDYVTCQLCGHKAVSLISHVRSVHSEHEGKYLDEFPNNQIMANCCETRSTELWEKKYTKEQLLKYADENGEIIVSDAEIGLGCTRTPIKRLCDEYGLKTRNNRAFQKSVMEHVKQVLLGAEYDWEYRDSRIRSLKNSRYLLSFDGYFPDYNLIVEAHGKQHFERIPYFHKDEGTFEYQQRLDRHKLESAIELGYTYLEIRYDEPYTDLRHLRTRLRDLQVEIVGDVTRVTVRAEMSIVEDEEVNFLDVAGE